MNIDRFGPAIKGSISIIVILAFCATIAVLFMLSYSKVELQSGVKEVLLVMLGVLAGAFKDVCGYWLGSSAGSARKTEINAALLSKDSE